MVSPLKLCSGEVEQPSEDVLLLPRLAFWALLRLPVVRFANWPFRCSRTGLMLAASPNACARQGVGGRCLVAPLVEPDCPGIDRVDGEMGLAPRVPRQRGTDGILRLGLDDMHHEVLVGERPAKNDKAPVFGGEHGSLPTFESHPFGRSRSSLRTLRDRLFRVQMRW